MTMQIKQLSTGKLIEYEVLVVNGKGIPLVIKDTKGNKAIKNFPGYMYEHIKE